MSKGCRLFVSAVLAFFPLCAFAQFAEQNVNMVAGTSWPGGDPFLRQQNEPSIAVSTRNAMHLVGGSNDYRSVDIAFPTPPRPDDEETGDAWLGVYKSFDGGNRWVSNLLDGYPQQNNLSSPLNGFQAAAGEQRLVLLRRHRAESRNQSSERGVHGALHRSQQRRGRRSDRVPRHEGHRQGFVGTIHRQAMDRGRADDERRPVHG